MRIPRESCSPAGLNRQDIIWSLTRITNRPILTSPTVTYSVADREILCCRDLSSRGPLTKWSPKNYRSHYILHLSCFYLYTINDSLIILINKYYINLIIIGFYRWVVSLVTCTMLYFFLYKYFFKFTYSALKRRLYSFNKKKNLIIYTKVKQNSTFLDVILQKIYITCMKKNQIVLSINSLNIFFFNISLCVITSVSITSLG